MPERSLVCVSNSANPFAVFPHGLERGEVAGIENIFGGVDEVAALQIIPGVAGADGDELENAGVAVAINHAAGAAVADELGPVELIDVAHRGFPEMATVEV